MKFFQNLKPVNFFTNKLTKLFQNSNQRLSYPTVIFQIQYNNKKFGSFNTYLFINILNLEVNFLIPRISSFVRFI